MSHHAWAWLLSGAGALFFFAAGLMCAALFARRTRVDELRDVPLPDASGEALRALLARETARPGLTGAVIADDAGLVVASTGDFGEVLAAYGAALVDLGQKTRAQLPLKRMRTLVLRDDGETTLTVRPIVTGFDQFSLVTLTSDTARASGARK